MWYDKGVQKLIISLIGHGGTGKTSTAKYLEEKYGFTTFTFSTVIREYAAKHGIELKKRIDYAHTNAQMIEKYGWDYALKIILDMPADRVCVDDLRSKPYVDVLRQAGGKEIALVCPTETRFAHVKDNPDRAKYPATLEDFVQNEEEDDAAVLTKGLKFDTEEIMKTAHYRIDTSGSLQDMYRQLDEIIPEIIAEHEQTAKQAAND